MKTNNPLDLENLPKDFSDREAQGMLNVKEAAAHYLRLRFRLDHPKGGFDRAGRWYADGQFEYCDCCKEVRVPTRAFPYSVMTHCRSVKHIAFKHGLDSKEMRKQARALKAKYEEHLASQ